MVTKRKIPVDELDGPAKKKGHCLCSVDGCKNYLVQSGVCKRHGAKVAPKNAITKNVPTTQRREVSVLGTEQRMLIKNAAMKDAPTLLSREESA